MTITTAASTSSQDKVSHSIAAKHLNFKHTVMLPSTLPYSDKYHTDSNSLSYKSLLFRAALFPKKSMVTESFDDAESSSRNRDDEVECYPSAKRRRFQRRNSKCPSMFFPSMTQISVISPATESSVNSGTSSDDTIKSTESIHEPRSAAKPETELKQVSRLEFKYCTSTEIENDSES